MERRLEVIAQLSDENSALVVTMQDAQARAEHCRAAEIELELLLREIA